MQAQAITIFLSDAAATRSLGVSLGQTLPAGSVLLLEGELGSGKTTLVQGLGEGLGIQDTIDSPTFTLINEYFEGRLPLYHLDLYRLNATATAELSLETYWDGTEAELGIVAIEWAERLPYKPANYLAIHLIYDVNRGRHLTIRAIGQGNSGQDDHGQGYRGQWDAVLAAAGVLGDDDRPPAVCL
ncbi:MAG TPA: tRNA (adenosine(37)-N6)-threonylcarbamoyltransferase complex ATPase subunit type 1 TsaE [Crinalium sp.]